MRASEVAELTMLHRIGRGWVTLFFVRMKYFFAWKVRQPSLDRYLLTTTVPDIYLFSLPFLPKSTIDINDVSTTPGYITFHALA